MSETTQPQPTTTQQRDIGSSERAPAVRGPRGAALQTEQGVTTIQDGVVAKIAGMAAREVSGVADLGGAAASALGGVVGRLRGAEHSTAGVGVEVGERQAAVDIAMKVQYPARIHEVASSVRENVIDRVESMTGLEVVEVNIAVIDLTFPGHEDEAPERQQQPQRVE